MSESDDGVSVAAIRQNRGRLLIGAPYGGLNVPEAMSSAAVTFALGRLNLARLSQDVAAIAGAVQSRQLETKRFAAASGQQGKHVAPGERRVDDLALERAERRVAEGGFEREQEIGHGAEGERVLLPGEVREDTENREGILTSAGGALRMAAWIRAGFTLGKNSCAPCSASTATG